MSIVTFLCQLHQDIPILHRGKEVSVREFHPVVHRWTATAVCKNRSHSVATRLGKSEGKRQREREREALSAIRTKPKETRWLRARINLRMYIHTRMHLFLSLSLFPRRGSEFLKLVDGFDILQIFPSPRSE